jgi:hypothetical protein
VSVAPHFVPALDVPNAGVLCALPALLAIGLLDGVERHLQLPKGYYGLDSLLLLMGLLLASAGAGGGDVRPLDDEKTSSSSRRCSMSSTHSRPSARKPRITSH